MPGSAFAKCPMNVQYRCNMTESRYSGLIGIDQFVESVFLLSILRILRETFNSTSTGFFGAVFEMIDISSLCRYYARHAKPSLERYSILN
jgi:hypothetical protein